MISPNFNFSFKSGIIVPIWYITILLLKDLIPKAFRKLGTNNILTGDAILLILYNLCLDITQSYFARNQLHNGHQIWD